MMGMDGRDKRFALMSRAHAAIDTMMDYRRRYPVMPDGRRDIPDDASYDAIGDVEYAAVDAIRAVVQATDRMASLMYGESLYVVVTPVDVAEIAEPLVGRGPDARAVVVVVPMG